MGHFTPDDDAIDELLTGPTGPVFRAVREFADAVVEAAVALAPVGLDEGGLLRDDLGIKEEIIEPGAIRIKIGTDPIDPRNGFGYGLVAHEGHGVLHARPGGLMTFYWPAVDRYVAFREIQATSGTPFLTDALRDVNAASGELFLLGPGA